MQGISGGSIQDPSERAQSIARGSRASTWTQDGMSYKKGFLNLEWSWSKVRQKSIDGDSCMIQYHT